jgi:diaminopimelate decarboxylase
MTGLPSQFGTDASWLLAEPQRFRGSGGAHVTGLHLYMGTNVDDVGVLAHQLASSVELAGRLRSALRLHLSEVNLGGGFGVPYARLGERPSYEGLAARLEPVLDEHLDGWRKLSPLVAFESGRYLVGCCGTLVCRVVDVKLSKGRTFVVLDSGVHHLGGMSALTRLPRVVPDLLIPEERSGWMEDCVVTGPLCTPLDTWSDGVGLPPLHRGDVVAVPNVGAYGLTASLLAFLGHPPAAEVVVDGAEVVSASRLALDRVPLPALAEPFEPTIQESARWTRRSSPSFGVTSGI